MNIWHSMLIAVAFALILGCAEPQQSVRYVHVCDNGTLVSDLSLCNASATVRPDINASLPINNTTINDTAIPDNQDQNNSRKNNSNKQQKNQTKPQNKQSPDDDGTPATGNEIQIPTDELNAQLTGNLLLGRPTNDSMTLNILAVDGMSAYSEYGTSPGDYTGKTSIVSSNDSKPIILLMDGLKPDSEYYYRVEIRRINGTGFVPSQEHTFHTQRPAGEGFTFAIQADPHRDGHTDENLYRATLQNELSARPDFLIDLGDTFMTEKFATSYDQVINRYIQDREFFGIVSTSVPVFLVNGNHDGEQGWVLDGTANNDAIWATEARKTYYLPPYNDSFYSGSTALEPIVGQRGSYYAWQWGDALFVTLDAYWYTKTNPKTTGDMWGYTLGDEQYKWLEQTLESSHAKYKFVFEHHVLSEVRGSTYWAPYFEWGGENKNGGWGFSTERPGWDLPIHQLMVKNNVTIFFQGHDHLFAKEDLDGIVYQTVPQPGNPNGDAAPGAEYNYNGIILPSSGYLRVNVSPDDVTVDYIKTNLGKAPDTAYSYTIEK